ncbi:MAG: putative membrane protein [Candidatus Azotimanducaceae bacterium]|jgi:predicted membrane protein
MIPSPLSTLELKKFGLTTALIFIILFGFLLPWLFDHALPIWPWIIAALLSLTALLAPSKLRSIHYYWMLVGTKLGWINSRIILGSIFFILFTPMGILMRLFGYDPLSRKRLNDKKSYRILRKSDERSVVEKMEHPY